jgi:hypothetical protein
MLRKRGVRTDATRIKTDTPPRDPGAMSGLLTGVSFIAGVGGAVALADSPYPRPGSEPAEVRRYFTENSRSARLSATGQLISDRFAGPVHRLGCEVGRAVGAGISGASGGGACRGRARRRVACDLWASHSGAQWPVRQGGRERSQAGPQELRLWRPDPRRRLRGADRRARACRAAHR